MGSYILTSHILHFLSELIKLYLLPPAAMCHTLLQKNTINLTPFWYLNFLCFNALTTIIDQHYSKSLALSKRLIVQN